MSRLVDQIKEALAAFAVLKTPPALIGGLALAAHNVVRATEDVDFLADAADADRLHDVLLKLGYRCLHRSEDAASYARGDERIDFLFAHRPASRALLTGALPRKTGMGVLRVVSAEGLIGFKLQGFINDPRRTRDLDDIRALLRANRGSINMTKYEPISACSNARRCSMNSSAKPASDTRFAPFVREGGAPCEPTRSADPIQRWIDLMEAVEALCPRWPERPALSGRDFRL